MDVSVVCVGNIARINIYGVSHMLCGTVPGIF